MLAKHQVARVARTESPDGNCSNQVHCRGCGFDSRTSPSSRILSGDRLCFLENDWMPASHLSRAVGRLRHFEQPDETCDRQGPNRANANVGTTHPVGEYGLNCERDFFDLTRCQSPTHQSLQAQRSPGSRFSGGCQANWKLHLCRRVTRVAQPGPDG